MARGNTIVVSGWPTGKFVEGWIGTGLTPKPGRCMQIDYSVAMVEGRHTWKYYTPGADGGYPVGPLIVLRENWYLNIGVDVAYAAGNRCHGYVPLNGDELNCLVKNLSGTADDHGADDILMIESGSGLLIASSGTPDFAPFTLNEAITDPTADTLAWVRFQH